MLVSSFIDYLLLEKNYSKHTVNAYEKDLQEFNEFLSGEHNYMKLKEANYSLIRGWIVNLSEKGLTNRSINRKISSLNSYFKFLLKINEIKINPLSKHKALKVRKKVQIPFSKDEVKMVLDDFKFDPTFEGIRNRLIVEIFYSTGVRRSELIQLQLEDIDESNQMLKVLGKRNKERYLPLLDSTLKDIKLYLEERSKLETIVDKGHLFLTKKGYKIYETLVYRIINNYFSKASTKVKRSPHILRHSFATHLLNQGADLNAVKELLGHASLAATQVYTNNSIAELKKVHEKSHPRNN